jgi:hypothetical protein
MKSLSALPTLRFPRRPTRTCPVRTLACLVGTLVLGACGGGDFDACALEDADGIIGGQYVLVLGVDDDGFSRIALKTQNDAEVTLTLENTGTTEAGFQVDCLPTPNDDGCAQESCFPPAHVIEPIAPGESATVTFTTPEVEGEYIYRAVAGDDSRIGQFIVD